MKKEQYIGIVIALLIAGLFFFGIGGIAGVFKSNQTTQMEDNVKVEVLNEGSGDAVMSGDKLTVHYTGTFEDGQKFDSSVDRGTPFTFVLGAGQVIKGWDQGLAGTKVGEKLKLTIPSSFGYGDAGVPDGRGGFVIPPKSTLIFDVEIVKIEKQK